MILIPELQTVLILTPRTGSGALKLSVAAAFPRSMLIYRHMEADGVPPGYDRWRKVGFVRDPVERLFSLYKFLQRFDGPYDETYIQLMRASVEKSFSEWIVSNQEVFTCPYDRAGHGRFFPHYTVRHPLPETRKSQFFYLRPDLGTEIIQYNNLEGFARDIGIKLRRENATEKLPIPALSRDAIDHIDRWFKWDLQMANRSSRTADALARAKSIKPVRGKKDWATFE